MTPTRYLIAFILQLTFRNVPCFVPDYGFGLFGLVSGEYHVDVTRDAVKFAAAQYFNELPYRPEGSRKIPLSDELFGLFGWSANNMFEAYYGKKVSGKSFTNALSQIETGVSRVDHEYNMKDNPNHHFDAERFDEANQVLIDFRMQVINLILKEQYESARDTLGVLLHTLQDFYSHSNWIELGNDLPNGNLGLPGRSWGKKAPYDMPTCTDCTKNCYIGICGNYHCRDNLAQELTERNLLTSGYYGGQFDGFAGVAKPPEYSKCSHGGTLDTTQNEAPVGGINKDSNVEKLSPHYYLHGRAMSVAKMATVEYVNGIRDTLQDDYKFGMFLGLLVGPAVTFFVDIVGAGNVTDKVETITRMATALIEESRKSGALPNFVLVPHNRPDFPRSVKTMSSDEINDFISALVSKEVKRRDAPRVGQLRGIKKALDESTYGSDVFVFTENEDPADGYLLPTILSQARQNKQQISIVNDELTERRRKRSARDRTLFDVLVERTGGSYLKSDSDLSQAFGSSNRQKDSQRGLPVTIMHTKSSSSLSKWLNFTIDSSITTFTVSVKCSSPELTLEIYSPMGQSRLDNKISEFNETTVTIRRITDDEVGLWKMNVIVGRSSGGYGFTVVVRGYSSVYQTVNLMVLDDRSVHPGLHTILSRPVAGENYTALCSLSDREAKLHAAQLTDANGEFVLEELELSPLTEMGRFYAFFTAPATSFLIRVVGESSAGQKLIRTNTKPVMYSHYEIRQIVPNITDSHLVPGSRYKLSFNVTSYHGDDSQRVVYFDATDNKNNTWIEDYKPRSTVLRGGQWFTATVTLQAPTTAAVGDTVRVFVTSGVRDLPDENTLDVNVTVFSRQRDTTKPECHVISSSWDLLCEGRNSHNDDCASALWSAALVFWDKGAGLSHTKTEVNGGRASATLSTYNFYGFVSRNVTAIVKGNCCIQSFVFRVYDKTGLQGACIFENTNSMSDSRGPGSGRNYGSISSAISSGRTANRNRHKNH